MGKAEAVLAQKAALMQAQDAAIDAALGATWDQSAVEQKASDGTLSQADLDAAVKAAVDPLMQQISDLQVKDAADVQAIADAKAAGDAALSDLQKKFDDLAAKEGMEASAIAGLQSAKSALESVLATLAGLQQPAPVPAPEPIPGPAPV